MDTIPTNQLSKPKEFALKVLDGFDKLARPEIKNIVFEKIWNYVAGYSKKVILNKPDEELQIKLFSIYKVFKEHFDNVEMAIEIKKGEALGSPKIPNLGEIAKARELTAMNTQKALKLIQDLNL